MRFQRALRRGNYLKIGKRAFGSTEELLMMKRSNTGNWTPIASLGFIKAKEDN